MSENAYSIRIKNFLEEWGEKNKDTFEHSITKILRRNTSIPIRSFGRKPKSINYKPDIIYIINFQDKIVFEILDTQIVLC